MSGGKNRLCKLTNWVNEVVRMKVSKDYDVKSQILKLGKERTKEKYIKENRK